MFAVWRIAVRGDFASAVTNAQGFLIVLNRAIGRNSAFCHFLQGAQSSSGFECCDMCRGVSDADFESSADRFPNSKFRIHAHRAFTALTMGWAAQRNSVRTKAVQNWQMVL